MSMSRSFAQGEISCRAQLDVFFFIMLASTWLRGLST
jgi:hypothetical protein|eukprot:COSAG06_NODE_827_length_12062_cov_46.356182_6_plen_37_part_00